MVYKKISGTIKHTSGSVMGLVRLHIDVQKSSLNSVFDGEIDVHELAGKSVRVFIPKVKNKEKKEKAA